jgi:hypothetical protein
MSLTSKLCSKSVASVILVRPFGGKGSLRQSRGTLGRFPQLLILFRREFEPNAAALPPNCFFKLLAAGDVQREAAALRHFPYLLVIFKENRSGQGRFEVFFKELAKPALPEHEVHINALLSGASATIAEVLSPAVRWGQRRFALATNPARVTLSNR